MFALPVHMEEEVQVVEQVDVGSEEARCKRDTRKGTKRGTEKRRENK